MIMEYEFNKKSEYETCKEVFETYVALLEESVIRDERIRENGEKLLHNIKAELKEREEKKLDKIEPLDKVTDYYCSRSRGIDKMLEWYGW